MEQINLPQATSSPGSIILSAEPGGIKNGDGLVLNTENQQAPLQIPNVPTPTQLGLDQGAMQEVYVSAIVSGGHVFLQVSVLCA